MTTFSIAIPQTVPDSGFDGPHLHTFLRRAEELGFEGAWTVESVIGTVPDLAPLETLSYAAACTERIRLGCAVLVSSLSSPLHLAKSIASVDQLSNGRLEIGLGTGGGFRKFEAFGVDRTSFVARFKEGLTVMRRVWSEDTVDLDGRFFQLHGVAVSPKPVQAGGPPIWFGGAHPAALRRAVAHADGFIGAGSQTTAAFAEQIALVRKALAEAGRDPATLRIAKRVYLAIDDDRDRARRRIGEALHRVYGYFGAPDLTPVSVTGTVDDVVAGVRQVIDAGAQMVLLNPMFDDSEQMEVLAAEVIARLG